MTISSQIRQAGPFIGSGVSTAFPFTFKVFASSDLYVVRLDTSTGLQTVLALTTDYTVTLNADQNVSPGGTLTLPAVLDTGYTLTITSSVPYLQPTDLTNQGGFYPSVITDALDRLTIFVQQIVGGLTKSLRFPLSDATSINAELPTASARALKYMAFDSTGAPIATAGTTDSTPISAYMKTVNASADAATARTNLGVSSTAQTNGKAVAMAIVFGGS